MNNKISQLPAPAVAGVIREITQRSAIASIKNCIYDGADMIDLHLSCLEDTSVEYLKPIIEASSRPILALNYEKSYDWQDLGISEDERVATMLRAVEAGAAAIDVQGYTFSKESKSKFMGEDKHLFTKDSPKEVVTDENIIAKQCELIEEVHSMGAEVLLSCHPGVAMNTEEVVELAAFLEKRNPDVIKIVTKATNDEELAESFKAMIVLKKEIKTPVSYHANGKGGMLSRIINPILGGQIAFCVDRYDEGSTMEQIDLRTAASIVRNMKKFI